MLRLHRTIEDIIFQEERRCRQCQIYSKLFFTIIVTDVFTIKRERERERKKKTIYLSSIILGGPNRRVI